MEGPVSCSSPPKKVLVQVVFHILVFVVSLIRTIIARSCVAIVFSMFAKSKHSMKIVLALARQLGTCILPTATLKPSNCRTDKTRSVDVKIVSVLGSR